MSRVGINQGGTRQGYSIDAQGVNTFTASDLNGLKGYFGEPAIALDPAGNRAITGKTLDEAYGNNRGNVKLTNYLIEAIVTGDGWWFRIAPPTIMEMNQKIDVLEMDLTAAKLVPEGAPHELVQYTERSISSKLERAVLGGQMTTGFFARPKGQEIFALSTRQVASGFWLIARLQVSNAILGCKDYWAARAENEGIPVSSVLAASQDQRSTFGMLQKRPKALYQLHHESVKIMSLGGVVPDMAVLPTDSLLSLALTPHETEALRVGAEKAATRLAFGGKSMVNIFEGFTIYEDVVHSANNLPKDEYAGFELLTRTGEYNFISYDHYHPERNEDKIQIYNMITNRWETLSLYEIVSKNLDMRWSDDGRLNNAHHDFVERIPELTKALGLDHPGPDVDPFVVFSRKAKEAGARNGGFYVPEYWGEVNPTFLSIDKVMSMAKQLYDVVSKELFDEDFKNITAMKTLMHDLASPRDISDPTIQAYLAAISFINTSPETSWYLKKNDYGVPDLPTFSLLPTAGANVRVLIAPMDGKEYVTIHMNKTENDVLKRVCYFVDKKGPYPGRKRDEGLTANWTIGKNTAGDASWGGPGAPLDADVNLVTDYPELPYGYGTLPGMRYLASIQNSDHGFDKWKLILEIARKGCASFRRFSKIYSSLIPITPLTDSSNLSEYLKSDSDEDNLETMLWVSVVDKSSYPTLLSASKKIKTMVAWTTPAAAEPKTISQIYYVASINTLDKIGGETGVVTNAKTGFKLDVFETGWDAEYKKVTSRDFIDNAHQTLMSDNFPEKIASAFLSPSEYKKNNNAFLKKLKPFLFNWIKITLDPTGGVGSWKDDDKFFLIELFHAISLTSMNASKAVVHALVASCFSALVVIVQNDVPVIRQFKTDDIKILSKNAIIETIERPLPSSPLSATEITGVSSKSPMEDTTWVNSRLVFDPVVWQKIARDVGVPWKFDALLARPPNPRNPLSPIVGGIFLSDGDSSKSAPVRKEIDEIVTKFAKGYHTFRSSDTTIQALRANQVLWRPKDSGIRTAQAELLSDANNWNDTQTGAYLEQSLKQIISWTTVLIDGPHNESSDIPRLVDRIFLKQRLEDVQKNSTNPAISYFAKGLLFANIHRDNVLALMRAGVTPWYTSILVTRPFIQQVTGSAIWAKSGNATARLGWNYASASLTLNSEHDMWTYKYIVWMNCTVVDESRILIRHNVLLKRYVSGRDTIPFTDPSSFDVQNPDLTRASIIYMNLGGEITREQLPDPISIVGALNRRDFPTRFHNEESIFRQVLQLPILFYIYLWNLHKLNDNRVRVDPISFMHRRADPRFNEICYSGDQRNWNRASQKFNNHYKGNSHWSGWGFDDDIDLLSIANGKSFNNKLLQSTAIKD